MKVSVDPILDRIYQQYPLDIVYKLCKQELYWKTLLQW